jgi:hypothetical protein
MTAEIVDVSANKRKLVTVRTISDINPIAGADAIVVATVEGWKVVVKKGEFNVGDQCVYFEIDSFLPEGNPAWQFLIDKSPRIFEGVKGHKLRTIKLRGQVSQGLVLKPEDLGNGMSDSLGAVIMNLEADCKAEGIEFVLRDHDLAPYMGIVKWEAALPACLAGQAEGLFPSFIQKTDQERCQNLAAEIFSYEDRLVPFDVTPLLPEALVALQEKGILEWVGDGLGGKWMKTLRAKADPKALYEITMKLDGSSMTAFARKNGPEFESGVCSRNLQLKVNEENAGNSFVKMAVDSGLLRALQELCNLEGIQLAVQGELMGPNIQGNREELKQFKLFIFDIQDLATSSFLTPRERKDIVGRLYELGVDRQMVGHVPTYTARGFVDETNAADQIGWTLKELAFTDVGDLLDFAEGPSIKHLIREGVVFKRFDGGFSFKAINDVFLAKEKD